MLCAQRKGKCNIFRGKTNLPVGVPADMPPSGGGENAVPTAGGLPGSPGGDKRGRDTKVSLPLLTPQPFLRTRLPSVARLKARGPQGRLVLQGTILDRSGAFRSDGVRALHRMAAHCYARRATQSKFRALQPHMSETTPGIEPPYPRFAAHLRCVSAKEGKGSQEGTSTHLIRARRGKEDSGLRPKPLVSFPLLSLPVGTGSLCHQTAASPGSRTAAITSLP